MKPKHNDFQERVDTWLNSAFEEEKVYSITARNHRFLEEALELVQACGCSKSEAQQIVDYVYSREVGEIPQEIGGVMSTLAALGTAHYISIEHAAETELARCEKNIDKIRAKNNLKPNFVEKK